MYHIAFCLDNNYIAHCCSVMASITENNRDVPITFHLISDFIEKKNLDAMDVWTARHKNIKTEYHEVKADMFRDFPIGDAYINMTTYFRLLIPELIKDTDKVLYLDCDVTVNSQLGDLWNTDMTDCAVAGVRDRINDSIRLYNRLGYDMKYGYINAGVLLINLKKWREENIFGKALELAMKNPTVLKNHDQDIINMIFHDSKKILDFKYNLLEYYLYTEDWLYMDRKYYPEIIEACKNPAIIHFCMPQKPWHRECVNPYRELYVKYRKMTPWPELKLEHKTERISNKQRLKLVLEKLGLYKVERRTTLRKDINVIEDTENVLF